MEKRRDRPRLRFATQPDRRIAELLFKYPDLSEAEREEISQFLDTACPLEIERLRQVRVLQSKLASFQRDQRRLGGLTAREAAIVALLVSTFLGTCWVLWTTPGF